MDYLIKNLLPNNVFNLEASLTATAIGAIIFSLAVIYIIAPRLEKLDTDKQFYISTLPWLISAGGLSALYASGQTDILINGVIFTGLTATLMATIHIGEKLEERTELDKSYLIFITGTISSIAVISLLDFSNTSIFLQTGKHITMWLGPLTIIYYLINPKTGGEILAPIATHFMDASSTVVSISNGAVEKQFIARLFIENLGPYGIFALKAMAIIPIVYIIDRETENKERIFYLYTITALGLVITVRNTLLTATGL